MKIFIYIDNDDLEDIAAQIEEAITTWVAGCGCTAEAVSRHDEQAGDRMLGMTIETGNKAVLKRALDFLYGVAKDFEQDFVVGVIDIETGAAEKVCYFGDQEGRPDIDEIGSYLGLRR